MRLILIVAAKQWNLRLTIGDTKRHIQYVEREPAYDEVGNSITPTSLCVIIVLSNYYVGVRTLYHLCDCSNMLCLNVKLYEFNGKTMAFAFSSRLL